jgi:hypothetical protein
MARTKSANNKRQNKGPSSNNKREKKTTTENKGVDSVIGTKSKSDSTNAAAEIECVVEKKGSTTSTVYVCKSVGSPVPRRISYVAQ